MKLIVLIIGLPGVGKSFLAKKVNKSTGFPYVSSDLIRAKLLEIRIDSKDQDYTSDELEKTYQKMAITTEELLQENDGVIVEGVYRKHKHRLLIYKLKQKYPTVNILLFHIVCKEQETVQRIIKRKVDGTVSPAGENTYYKIKEEFEKPTKDENAIVINNDSFSSDSYIRIMDIISQNNIINHGDLL